MSSIIKGMNSQGEKIKIEIDGEKILSVAKDNHNITDLIVPGFIDRHVHGGYGTDFMDASEEATTKFLTNLPSEGCTSIVHTSITCTDQDLKKALLNVNKFIENPKPKMTQIVGVHIEGTYLAVEKKGAHNEKLFKPLTIDEIDNITKITDHLKVITYAIENSTPEVTKELVKRGIVPSVGHSNATFSDVEKHIVSGLSTCTHLHNAMTGYGHRLDNMGIVNSVFKNKDMEAEIIVDGIHVDKDVVKDAYNIKGSDKLLSITDSIRPKGLKDGEYESGGFRVFKKGKEIRTERGEIAGSSQTMISNFNNLINFTGCSIQEAEIMTSYNVARQLKLEGKGKIEKGYDADIVILKRKNDEYVVDKTYCRGELAYGN